MIITAYIDSGDSHVFWYGVGKNDWVKLDEPITGFYYHPQYSNNLYIRTSNKLYRFDYLRIELLGEWHSGKIPEDAK